MGFKRHQKNSGGKTHRREKRCLVKRLVCEIYKEHLKLNNKKTTQLKNGHRILRAISPKKTSILPISEKKC